MLQVVNLRLRRAKFGPQLLELGTFGRRFLGERGVLLLLREPLLLRPRALLLQLHLPLPTPLHLGLPLPQLALLLLHPVAHVHAAVHDLRLERLEFCRDSLPLHRLGLLPLPLLLERAAVVPNLREAEVSRCYRAWGADGGR